jgi:eukaryotic-like serine/threonine-protein kinase
MDDRDELVNWTNDDLAIAELKERAIDAECDGELGNALSLWEQIRVSAKREGDRERALKKIENLAMRLSQPQIISPQSIPAPSVQNIKPTSALPNKADHPQIMFTRRNMLYLGLGSVGTAGAIALGFNNSHQPKAMLPSPSPTPLPPSIIPSPSPSPTSKIILESFSFLTVQLNSKGEIIKRETLQGQQFISAFDIKMIKIIGGRFRMGSPGTETDRMDDEGLQRDVTISDFFMGKCVVTQAQWKAVSALPKVKIDLNPNPSKFTGDRLPVESVSWLDAMEFCERLSVHTGLTYRLPTEAQWEYACRAGTTTPFYFGETITTDVANFNGNSTYGKASKGVYREKTIEVDSFDPNAFGLYNMHGNVLEWCLDPWHENYNGAPNDDRVWDASNNSGSEFRTMRGGSWRRFPDNSRSANRSHLEPEQRDNSIGFRVALSNSIKGLSSGW